MLIGMWTASERQITTTLVGSMNVIRAVLPVMREQRSGHVVTISSSAGFAGYHAKRVTTAHTRGAEDWSRQQQRPWRSS